MALGQGLIRREQSPSAFIEERRCLAPAPLDVGNVDHATRLTDTSRVAPGEFATLFVLCSGLSDSFIPPQAQSHPMIMQGSRRTEPEWPSASFSGCPNLIDPRYVLLELRRGSRRVTRIARRNGGD